MSFVIVDALEEALVLAKYGRARRVSEDVDRAVAVWCFVKFLQWAEDEAWEDAVTEARDLVKCSDGVTRRLILNYPQWRGIFKL